MVSTSWASVDEMLKHRALQYAGIGDIGIYAYGLGFLINHRFANSVFNLNLI